MSLKTDGEVNEVVALRYIDPVFFYKRPRKWPKFVVHTTIGKLVSSDNDKVVIEFSEKNKKTDRGLLIPRGAVFSPTNQIQTNEQNSLAEGSVIKIVWKDVVYFENGDLPKQATEINTEGYVILSNSEAVVIRNTKTFVVRNTRTEDFPANRRKPAYFVIPKSVISSIQKL